MSDRSSGIRWRTAAALALVASAALAVGGTLRGVVVAKRPAQGGDDLVVAAPTAVDGRPVDEIRLDLPKRSQRSVEAKQLPEGWSLDWQGSIAILSGPPAPPGGALAIALGDPRGAIEGEIGVALSGGSRELLSGRTVPSLFDLPGLDADPEEFLKSPDTVAPGESVGLRPLDPAATPPGGDWKVGGEPLEWNGDFESPEYEWKVSAAYRFGDDLKLRVDYGDPWGGEGLGGDWQPIRIGAGFATTDDRPRITGCSPRVLSDGTLCVCGHFPTEASRTSLTIDGRPLGQPTTASRSLLRFKLPEGLSPGEFFVRGPGSAGYGDDAAASGIHIQVEGEIDREKLWQGESTPLRLRLLGTTDQLSLRLWNTTPGIVSLVGGENQTVTSSGGATNLVETQVDAVSPGDFLLHYELALDECPCATDGTTTVPGDSGLATAPPPAGDSTRVRSDCDRLKRECDELRREMEALEKDARSARRAAERAAEEQERFDDEAEYLDEVSEADRKEIATLRRQAAEWRELAKAAEAQAEKNWKRDKKYPGSNWDYWARYEEKLARERKANADRLEQQANALERKARENSDRAEELRGAAEAAEAKAAAAEAAAARARAAWEACLRRLAERCPAPPPGGTTTGGTTTGPGGTAIPGGETPGGSTPPPTTYGEEDDDKVCPQRDGAHPQCVALLVDEALDDWRPGSLVEAQGTLESMGCDVDYVAPKFRAVPPESYWTETSIWSWTEMRFKTHRYVVNTTAQRDAAVVYNRREMAKVTAAIEAHRAKLRAGAILGVEIFFGHGSEKSDGLPCGALGPAYGFWHNKIDRVAFHQANYDAAKGNVCNWYTLDLSCYSWQSVRAVDNLNNRGTATCETPNAINRTFHAGYEGDVAHSCAHQGLWEVCNGYQTSWLLDNVEDTFEDEVDRRSEAGYDASGAMSGLATDLRSAADSSAFDFSTYADHGYEMCVGRTHTRLGPYWE